MTNGSRLTDYRLQIAGYCLLLTMLLLTWAMPAQAQDDTPVTAEIDRNSITLDETVVLTVTAVGEGNAQRPILPPLPGFQVVGSASTTQVTLINGVASTQASYVYRLRPLDVGTQIIGEIEVTFDGQTYFTEPLRVEVTQGNGNNPAPSDDLVNPVPVPEALTGEQDFFVSASVDKETPFMGEQVLYSFQFFQGVNALGQRIYDEPEFEGFWNQRETQQLDYFSDVNGRRYRVAEVQSIIFPTVPGEKLIPPATLTFPSFSGVENDEVLFTEAIPVNVKPLPIPAPTGFAGAVGEFDIVATVNREITAVNDPLTLAVTVRGVGSIDTLPAPTLPTLDGWRVFEGDIVSNTVVRNGRLAGERTFFFLLTPSQTGEIGIPPIEYVHFDPERETYQTSVTEPIVLTVMQGDAAMAEPVAIGEETAASPAANLRPIKTEAVLSWAGGDSLLERPSYWLLWLLPLLGVAGIFYHGAREAQSEIEKGNEAVTKEPLVEALAALEKAERPFEAVTTIISGYLSQKLRQPVAGLSTEARARLLAEYGVDEPLIRRLRGVLAKGEIGRFAPDGQADEAALLAEAQGLLQALDEILE